MVEVSAGRIIALHARVAELESYEPLRERIAELEKVLRMIRDDLNACSCGDYAKEVARRALGEP